MKKILIIRFSSIGDIVLTTPVIRAVKNQIEDCELHYLTKSSFRPVLEANPYIDKLWSFNSDLNEVLPDLKQEGFEFVIDLHKNLRSKITRFNLRTKAAAFSKINFQKWIMVNMKHNIMPDVHIVDRYLKPAKRLNVINDGLGLDYFIPENARIEIQSLPDFVQYGFVALVIGGAHETKQMPEDKLFQLISDIKKPIVLLGGPAEKDMGNRIEKVFPNHVYNSAGLFKLNQSASILNLADCVISGDTGLMHIAAALNKDIYSIWGNTVPEFGMYPYCPEKKNRVEIIEVKGLSCRPCSKIGYKKCPKGHFDCMNKQDFSSLIRSINEEC